MSQEHSTQTYPGPIVQYTLGRACWATCPNFSIKAASSHASRWAVPYHARALTICRQQHVIVGSPSQR